MTNEVTRQIAGLQQAATRDLRELYERVHGEPTRSGNRQWMIRRIAWRLQSQAEGGLTERAAARAAELARDEDVRVRPPSDLDVPVRGRELRTASGRMVLRDDDRVPPPGTVISREYKGVEHQVMVLDDGFEYDGKKYRTLTAIADRITGSHWNGHLFFGLKKRSGGGAKA